MADRIIDTNETVAITNNVDRERERARMEHEGKIAENYKKLLDQSVSVRERAPVVTPAPEKPVQESRPPMIRTEIGADNNARIHSYRQPPAPAKTRLFEDVHYVQGSYMTGHAEAVAPSPVFAPAPAVQTEMYVPAPAPAETFAPAAASEDELMPTPLTMRHRREEAEAVAQETGVGFWAALSSKTKLALAAIAAAIVVCVMIICINTAALGSMNRGIAERRLELDRLGREYRQVQQQIERATDPDNVDNWAQQSGMVKD